ncbi:MAG: hypothetical protein M1830_004811, partial [Pleopsidium flavum]
MEDWGDLLQRDGKTKGLAKTAGSKRKFARMEQEVDVLKGRLEWTPTQSDIMNIPSATGRMPSNQSSTDAYLTSSIDKHNVPEDVACQTKTIHSCHGAGEAEVTGNRGGNSTHDFTLTRNLGDVEVEGKHVDEIFEL